MSRTPFPGNRGPIRASRWRSCSRGADLRRPPCRLFVGEPLGLPLANFLMTSSAMTPSRSCTPSLVLDRPPQPFTVRIRRGRARDSPTHKRSMLAGHGRNQPVLLYRPLLVCQFHAGQRRRGQLTRGAAARMIDDGVLQVRVTAWRVQLRSRRRVGMFPSKIYIVAEPVLLPPAIFCADVFA